MIRRWCAHTYMNTYEGTATNPETRTAQGLTGCAEKKLIEHEKSVDRGITPGVYFMVSGGYDPDRMSR